MTGTLYSDRQHTLMLGTVAVDTTRQNLAPLRYVSSKLCYILIAQRLAILGAEAANTLFAAHGGSLLLRNCHDKNLLFLIGAACLKTADPRHLLMLHLQA